MADAQSSATPGGPNRPNVTNATWVKAAVEHRETDRVPYHFHFTPPAFFRTREYFGVTDIEEAFNFPIRDGAPADKPLYASPAEYGPFIRDQFGVTWTTNEIDRGAPIGPCLPEADLSSYRFPEPASRGRFAKLDRWCEQNRGNYRLMWVGDLWERATFMRGTENLLLDLSMHPRFVRDLLRGIADYVLATMEILLERYEFEAIALSDDWGTQQSLLISPSHWRQLVKPLLSEIYSFARERGRHVFQHSDGNISSIIGDLVEIGLDILHPIQPETMDILRLKREFGRDLTFCGGIGTQRLLASATPEEVRAEVRHVTEALSKGGGYILSPAINLQDDVPVENIAALLEEAGCTLP